MRQARDSRGGRCSVVSRPTVWARAPRLPFDSPSGVTTDTTETEDTTDDDRNRRRCIGNSRRNRSIRARGTRADRRNDPRHHHR